MTAKLDQSPKKPTIPPFVKIEKECMLCNKIVVVRDERKLEFPICGKCMPKFEELFCSIAKMNNKNRKSLIQVLKILEKKKGGKTKAAVRFILHSLGTKLPD